MFLLSIWVGKLIFYLVRTLKLGGGSAAPGLYALKIYPNLIQRLSQNIPQSIFISGTNGKTTTARLLAHFTKGQNIKTIHNSTGSNMERGIASTLIDKADWLGRVKNIDLAIWEVDEAGVKILAPKIKPQIMVFLNAARDQLDRYGELDSLIQEWEETLKTLSYQPLVLINNDDANTLRLKNIIGINFETFGLDKQLINWEKNSAHRAKPNFLAQNIKVSGLDSVSFQLTTKNITTSAKLPMGGIYNVYNTLAALSVADHLNLPIKTLAQSLFKYQTVFGRIEKIPQGYILLIKNPNGTNQVLSTLNPVLKPEDHLLLALNDNLADGTDVSWIWDVEFESLTRNLKTIITSGTRAYDLALRLKYADFNTNKIIIEPDLSKALKLTDQKLKGQLYILPTYTALLELQKILAKQGLKKHYWRET